MMQRRSGPLQELERNILRCWSNCCGITLGGESTADLREFAPLLASADDAVTTGITQTFAPAQQQTLHPCAISHPDPAHAHAPCTVLVMRHAHRQDEADDAWTETALRPWDPPLSQHGRNQAIEAAQALADQQGSLQIEYVVTSPYQRCLQTSAEIVARLNLPQGRWLVDWGLGEVSDPRLLLGGRPELAQQLQGRPLDSWMWGGMGATEALSKFTRSEAGICRPAATPQMLPRPAPPFPESHEAAIARYRDELTWVMDGGLLQGNVLVVTHGEAVRAAVNLCVPDATVYEVKHCGFLQLERGAGATAQQKLPTHTLDDDLDAELLDMEQLLGPKSTATASDGPWGLTSKSGDTGVSWFA